MTEAEVFPDKISMSDFLRKITTYRKHLTSDNPYLAKKRIEKVCEKEWENNQKWKKEKTLSDFLKIPGYRLIYELGLGSDNHSELITFLNKLNEEGEFILFHNEPFFIRK